MSLLFQGSVCSILYFSAQGLRQIFVVHFFQRIGAVVRNEINRAEEHSARAVVCCDFLVAPNTEYGPADDFDGLFYARSLDLCLCLLLLGHFL
jgi:hypothetical protein